MAKAKVFHGARAILYVGTIARGIFNNASWSYGLEDQEVPILGAFAPVEIAYVGASTVTVRCTGWRIIGHGPHQDGMVPKLNELLNYQDIQLVLMDRQSGPNDPPVMKLRDVKPLGYDTGVASKSLSEVTITYKGLRVDDESGPNEESNGAATLPGPAGSSTA
jgi:hypothetical protein